MLSMNFKSASVSVTMTVTSDGGFGRGSGHHPGFYPTPYPLPLSTWDFLFQVQEFLILSYRFLFYFFTLTRDF